MTASAVAATAAALLWGGTSAVADETDAPEASVPVATVPVASVPVATVPVYAGAVRHDDDSAGFLPLVDVEVAGTTLRMMLDTGSQGLVVHPGALDGAPGALTITDAVADLHYDGANIDGHVALAEVSVGGVTAAEPVPFALADACDPARCLGGEGVHGIIGVSQGFNEYTASDGTVYVWYSALAQLPEPASLGYTLRFDEPGTSDGEQIGTLELGAPSIAAEGVTTLQAEATGARYPDGQAVYDKPVRMCWTIAGVSSCHQTVLDSGEYSSVLFGSQFQPFALHEPNPAPWPGVPSVSYYGPLQTGTAVAFGAPDAGEPFWSRTVGPAYRAMGLFEDTTGAQGFNTGNLFFIGRSVGFDRTDGRVLVGPVTGLPAQPEHVEASAVDRRLAVAWQQATGDHAIESYVVRLRTAEGKTIAEHTLPADARTTTFDELHDGTAYRAEVAAANARGLGAWTSSAEVRVGPQHDHALPARLPETGPGDVLRPMLVTALLLGGGLVLVGVAARRRTKR
ncbi:fibronectin type III domain-containing protein [Agromyces aerolatus]|uniref:fibronectin type III domain-containing protein n=1 Tax=Agromyces sp. LY-1074 TaxID=3074080 RepID=UPI002865EFFE|nr:fibronectin type III domain-containing protein [Agromyces sp. LY-1074]MDR5701361.1 fibronectin type III domain-containing protein [Agromyces sp. LY-1074]